MEFPKCKECKGAGGYSILIGTSPDGSRCHTCHGSGVDLDATHGLFMALNVQLARTVSAVAHLYDYLNELPDNCADTCAIGRAADILNTLSDVRPALAIVEGRTLAVYSPTLPRPGDPAPLASVSQVIVGLPPGSPIMSVVFDTGVDTDGIKP